MVREQILARGLDNPRMRAAMLTVPRHFFLPQIDALDAYGDHPAPIARGQTISQPYMVAAMTAFLNPQPHEKILEIGTGSGYQTAILASLARYVVSIERHIALSAAAGEQLRRLGCRNVEVICGDGTAGWRHAAPYDGILVTAGAPQIPDALVGQLAVGGRLVIPVGGRARQQLLRLRREATGLHRDTAFDCVFVPLIGQDAWPEQ